MTVTGRSAASDPDHCSTPRRTIDLPDDIVLPVKTFLFWLVVLMWRRAK